MVDYRYWWLMIDELDDVVRYSNKTTTETDTKDLQNWKRHILLYCMLFIYTPCFTYCIFISSFCYYILIIDFILYTILFTLYIYIHCFHNKKVICLGGESCSSKFLTFLAANTENTGPRRTTRPMFLQPKKVSISGCIKKIAQRGTSQSIESSKYLSSKSCVKAIVQGLSFLMRSPFFLFESKYLRQEVIIPQMMGIFT